MIQYKEIRFKKILVGVDLSGGDMLVSDEIAPTSREAVDQAVQLAGTSGAEIHFLFALDVGARARQLIDNSQGLAENLLDRSRQALEILHAETQQHGLVSRSTVVFGKSWLELIRQSLRDGSDILIVGRRNLGGLRGALVGSTGMRLLRKCPCPVWITRPLIEGRLDQVLVATDFSPVCRRAVDLAATMARLYGARLQLVHVLDLPDESGMRGLVHAWEDYEVLRGRFQQEAREMLEAEVARLAGAGLATSPQILLLNGNPGEVIQRKTQEMKTDLLVMGTVARSGLPALLMGNTAERVMPIVQCSILALKPPDFECPIAV